MKTTLVLLISAVISSNLDEMYFYVVKGALTSSEFYPPKNKALSKSKSLNSSKSMEEIDVATYRQEIIVNQLFRYNMKFYDSSPSKSEYGRPSINRVKQEYQTKATYSGAIGVANFDVPASKNGLPDLSGLKVQVKQTGATCTQLGGDTFNFFFRGLSIMTEGVFIGLCKADAVLLEGESISVSNDNGITFEMTESNKAPSSIELFTCVIKENCVKTVLTPSLIPKGDQNFELASENFDLGEFDRGRDTIKITTDTFQVVYTLTFAGFPIFKKNLKAGTFNMSKPLEFKTLAFQLPCKPKFVHSTGKFLALTMKPTLVFELISSCEFTEHDNRLLI